MKLKMIQKDPTRARWREKNSTVDEGKAFRQGAANS